jgi:hypothetical protein
MARLANLLHNVIPLLASNTDLHGLLHEAGRHNDAMQSVKNAERVRDGWKFARHDRAGIVVV